MRLNEVVYPEGRPVDGYGPGFFRIAGEVHRGGVAVLPAGVMAWAGFEDAGCLLEAAGRIDVLFLGTGPEIAQAPQDLRQRLEAVGIGVEVSNSPAACRTYNVLLSEGRRVGLAALPV